MLRLVVRQNGQTVQSLDLDDKATTYWAGRGENAQIRLDSFDGISRQHFKIFFSDDKWILEVVSRFNEIRVGSQELRTLQLNVGVSFSLLSYLFTVEPYGGQPQAQASLHGFAGASQQLETVNLQGLNQPALISNDSPPPSMGADGNHESGASEQRASDVTQTLAVSKSIQAVLLYKAPHTKEPVTYPIVDDSFVIGREGSASLIIDDPKFSRKQFKITRAGNRYYIKDFLGVNGTFLNKKKITTEDALELQSGDQIVVLRHKFLFEVRDPQFAQKVEQARAFAVEEPELPPEIMPPAFEGPASYGASDGGGISGGYAPPMAPPPPFHNSSNDPYDRGPTGTSPQYGSMPMGESLSPQEEVRTLNFGSIKIPLTKQNKIRLGVGIALFLLVIVLASEDDGGFKDDNLVAAAPADPLSKLSAEERAQLKTQYQLANELYEKGSFQLAKDELEKVLAKVPSYENSADLMKEIDLKIASLRDREEAERAQKEAEETEQRIRNIAMACRQQIQPETTLEQIDACLNEAIALNPEHEMVLKVREEVRMIDEKRKRDEAERLYRESQIAQLKEAYEKAKALSAKNPLAGIGAYEDFLKLVMPDPDKLQDKARVELKGLRHKIKWRVTKAIRNVQKYIKQGQHKQAIIELEKAQIVSPDDETLKNEIDRVTLILKTKMQVIYQEAILEENLGNRDTAKELWSRILKEDIPNGEYYIKSKIRLTRIGVL